ncbi:hypothetical protein [Trinickia acidisoli]|uniref:hypothetical protein n=1 Tax=Trinickia acidisoli TaxID=2767482 RepID=UPI001A8DBB11|nr:hypothetical protein [Trinickia acidisoli]
MNEAGHAMRLSRWALLMGCVVLSHTVRAQEVSALAGWLRANVPGESTYAWGFSYLQPLDAHNALSYSWLNEGHVRDNHRDGFALQYWRRTTFADPRLTLGAGVGGYYYFDTEASANGRRYIDAHGLSPIFSLAATWHANDHLFYQLRLNEVLGEHSYNTFSAMFGIGYAFDTPKPSAPPAGGNSNDASSGNQIAAMAGWTEVNSLTSPGAAAYSVEYRHGFGPYLDGTLSWINEGHTALNTRSGVAAQAWLRRAFFDNRLSLAIGAGPYYATDTRRIKGGTDTDGKVSVLLTMSAAYDFTRRWFVRASWNRVMTSYDKDSDIYLGGVGYRF